MTCNISTKSLIILQIIATVFAQFNEIENFKVEDQSITSTGVIVSWSKNLIVEQYRIRVASIYTPANIIKEHHTEENRYQITDLSPNCIYKVDLQGMVGNEPTPYFGSLSFRTNPEGTRITNFITEPDLFTIILEEIPGVTQWEIKYSESGSQPITVVVPQEQKGLKSSYISTITGIKSNTIYEVQARPKMLAGSQLLPETVAYGEAMRIKTDRRSVFGTGILRQFNSTLIDVNDQEKISVVEEKIASACQNASSFHRVKVIDLKEMDTDIVCFYEIFINDQIVDVNDIDTFLMSELLDESSLFTNNTLVQPSDILHPVYYKWRIIDKLHILRPVQDKAILRGNGIITWTLFGCHQEIESQSMKSTQSIWHSVKFSDQNITAKIYSDQLEKKLSMSFKLQPNEIYVIKQSYLFQPLDEAYRKTHTTYHSYKGSDTMIVHSTGIPSFKFTPIQIEASKEDASIVFIVFNATAIKRAVDYKFVCGTSQVILKEDYLDSSDVYRVKLNISSRSDRVKVNVIVRIRSVDGKIKSFKSYFNIERCNEELIDSENRFMECTNGNLVGSICKFKCSDLYGLKSRRSITCSRTGSWSSPPPTCEKIRCNSTLEIKNGAIHCDNSNEIGSTCTLSCANSFAFSKPVQQISCNDDDDGDIHGEWSIKVIPECQKITCKKPRPPLNGIISCANSIPVGSSCSFSCKSGFGIVDMSTTQVKCLTDQFDSIWGRWGSTTDFKCKTVTCERLRAPLHGKVNCTKGNTIDSKCTYSCNSDYYLSSSQTAKCVVNNLSSIGKWDNHNLPTCKPVVCAHTLTAPSKGFVSCTKSNRLGSICNFKCHQGFFLTKDSPDSVQCKLNKLNSTKGMWTSEKIPKCQMKKCTLKCHRFGKCKINFDGIARCHCNKGYHGNGHCCTSIVSEEKLCFNRKCNIESCQLLQSGNI